MAFRSGDLDARREVRRVASHGAAGARPRRNLMQPVTTHRDGSHDFDFWPGRWHVRNERLVKRLQGCTEWETFESRVEARLLPGGLGNVDEFHTDHWPGFVGMSFRF